MRGQFIRRDHADSPAGSSGRWYQINPSRMAVSLATMAAVLMVVVGGVWAVAGMKAECAEQVREVERQADAAAAKADKNETRQNDLRKRFDRVDAKLEKLGDKLDAIRAVLPPAKP